MGNSVGDSTGRFANKVRHKLDERSDFDDSMGNDMGMKVDSEDVPKRTSNGNHGKGTSMQRRVWEEKFGPWMVVVYRQRRNSRSGVKAKDASSDRKAEESKFTVLSENHEGMKDDGLNAIKDNEGNIYSRTVITYQNLLVREKTVPLIKSKGFKK
ncbi:hypothetical protein Goari_018012 [Gossypium aridum]|uniref:Uncharacterized protein n=1 Tax=Gossypium aridum TaxID=34290 RepID=A0A7J8WNC8_GOSAI|nr:hypothetical protein [Gossypium aridum]